MYDIDRTEGAAIDEAMMQNVYWATLERQYRSDPNIIAIMKEKTSIMETATCRYIKEGDILVPQMDTISKDKLRKCDKRLDEYTHSYYPEIWNSHQEYKRYYETKNKVSK